MLPRGVGVDALLEVDDPAAGVPVLLDLWAEDVFDRGEVDAVLSARVHDVGPDHVAGDEGREGRVGDSVGVAEDVVVEDAAGGSLELVAVGDEEGVLVLVVGLDGDAGEGAAEGQGRALEARVAPVEALDFEVEGRRALREARVVGLEVGVREDLGGKRGGSRSLDRREFRDAQVTRKGSALRDLDER